MDTENARVTIEEAALLTGVSSRTVRRWSAAGLLTDIRYGPVGSTIPATYSREEVLAAPEAWADIVAAALRGRVKTQDHALPEAE